MPACLDPGCGDAASDDAPIALCAHHGGVAADWAGAVFGVVDVAPSPCRVCGSRLGVRWPSGWLCADCEWRHGEIIDDELPPPRVDVVYYLAYADRVKIGTTANPRQRLAAIRHDRLLAFERGGRALEQRRHAEFADLRFPRTEWFRRGPALDAHLAEVAAGVEDPWALHTRWMSAALALRG